MTMIEKCARAIQAAEYGNLRTWDETDDRYRAFCVKLARAALQALREPSEEMGASFVAAIDQILSEQVTC